MLDNGNTILLIFVAVAVVMAAYFYTFGVNTKVDAQAVKIPSLVTAAELKFFNQIYGALDHNKFVMCPKVRLGDLVKFTGGEAQERWKRLQQVNRKHIDFVVCERASMSPVYAIELDDSSHQRKDRRDRDALVDFFMRQAGIPLLHVKCQYHYKTELRDVIISLSQKVMPTDDILGLAKARVHS